MTMKGTAVLLCCMIICLVGTSSVFGQEAGADLKDKRITVKMESQPLGVVFRYLMENYDIPIGFEQSVLDRDHSDYAFEPNLPPSAQHKMNKGGIQFTTTSRRAFEAGRHPITLYIEDGSVEEVFTRIVEQMENYRWEINNDVVNIFPVKGRDKRFEELLGTKVSRFTFEKGKTVEDITTNIILLPEFGTFMRKYKLHFVPVRQGMTFVLEAQYGRVIDVDMEFSNLTFRDLLNRVTKVKRGGWVLGWRGFVKPREEYIHFDI